MSLVERYNPEWPRWFEKLERYFLNHLGDCAIRIEHVGSTSVPGLTAKPIIDLDIVIRPGTFDQARKLLEQAGYEHEGDKGILTRDAFKPIDPEVVASLPKHHLYVCPNDSPELARHVGYRDFMRRSPEYVERLSEVKWSLCEKHDNDRQAYMDGKAPLYEEIRDHVRRDSEAGKQPTPIDLIDIVQRGHPPEPWSEGNKIPWDDPGFSERMLREHLSQDHDKASRRTSLIDRSVSWILQTADLPAGARILDLGCGPGLYTSRFAQLGYQTVGLDFSPKSIQYARSEADRQGLTCTYLLEDIRTATFGEDNQLITFLYGELNVFTKTDAFGILAKAHRSLGPGGILIVEPSSWESFDRTPHRTSWHTSEQGLFSDIPHICLSETFWDETSRSQTDRHYVIDAESGHPSTMSSTTQAYSDAEYESMFRECGFTEITFHPSLTGDSDKRGEFFVIESRP